MCDGVIYDPCMCTDAPDCKFTFSPQSCPAGVILMPPSSAFDMASLHWPRLAWPDKATQALLDGWQAGPFIFFSSLDVYGFSTAPLIDEETPLDETHRAAEAILELVKARMA
jgi:hypothetical protein